MNLLPFDRMTPAEQSSLMSRVAALVDDELPPLTRFALVVTQGDDPPRIVSNIDERAGTIAALRAGADHLASPAAVLMPPPAGGGADEGP